MRLSVGLFLISFVSAYAQTAPPQAAGYSLVFSDEFNTLNLSPTGTGSYTWYPGIWWESGVPLPSLMTATNAVVDLAWSVNGGMNDTSISTFSRDKTQGRT